MSHFKVLVITMKPEDVDKVLAPYDENLKAPPIFRAQDEDDLVRMAKHYNVPMTIEALLPHMEDWCGSQGVVVNGKLGYMSTYNPNSKWDWYAIGGRWPGQLRAKDPSKARRGSPSFHFNKESDPYNGGFDQLQKCNLDAEGMRGQAERRVAKEWDAVAEVLQAYPETQSWEEIPDMTNIEEKRAFYHQQPAMGQIDKIVGPFGINDAIKCYREGRDSTIKNARASAIGGYAIVTLDGQWWGRGKMGWWGISTGDVSESEWAEKCAQLVDGTPDEAWLTMVDCHI